MIRSFSGFIVISIFISAGLILAGFMLTGQSKTSLAQTELFADHPMIKGAKNGDYTAVRAQLLKNVDANTTGARNITALIIAAQRGYPDIVSLMFEFGAFPNYADNLGNSALFYAVEGQDYESMETLLHNKADPNQRNRQGETPLMWAARSGDMETFHIVLDFGGDPRIKDYTGRGVLEYARNSRNPRMEDDLKALAFQD